MTTNHRLKYLGPLLATAWLALAGWQGAATLWLLFR